MTPAAAIGIDINGTRLNLAQSGKVLPIGELLPIKYLRPDRMKDRPPESRPAIVKSPPAKQ